MSVKSKLLLVHDLPTDFRIKLSLTMLIISPIILSAARFSDIIISYIAIWNVQQHKAVFSDVGQKNSRTSRQH